MSRCETQAAELGIGDLRARRDERAEHGYFACGRAGRHAHVRLGGGKPLGRGGRADVGRRADALPEPGYATL